MNACIAGPSSAEARVAAVRDALSRGARVNALYDLPIDPYGCTTLHGVSALRMASVACLLPVVREFLSARADPNMTNRGDSPPLAVVPDPFVFERRPDIATDGAAVVRVLLEAGASEKQRVNVIGKIKRGAWRLPRGEQPGRLAPILRALEEGVCVDV